MRCVSLKGMNPLTSNDFRSWRRELSVGASPPNSWASTAGGPADDPPGSARAARLTRRRPPRRPRPAAGPSGPSAPPSLRPALAGRPREAAGLRRPGRPECPLSVAGSRLLDTGWSRPADRPGPPRRLRILGPDRTPAPLEGERSPMSHPALRSARGTGRGAASFRDQCPATTSRHQPRKSGLTSLVGAAGLCAPWPRRPRARAEVPPRPVSHHSWLSLGGARSGVRRLRRP